MIKELNRREGEGLTITLWWFEPDNELSVTVNDVKFGETFTIDSIPPEKAMEVFNHPYAYRNCKIKSLV